MAAPDSVSLGSLAPGPPEPVPWDARGCVIVQVTAQCPLRCAHCIVESGPERREQLNHADLLSLLEDIRDDGRTSLVVLTGGEPFLKLDRLRAALALASRRGLRIAIVTSASWATSPDRALAVLRSIDLQPVVELAFSVDRHHLPFVSLEQVRHGMEAAVSLGVSVTAFVCLDSARDDFLERLRMHLGESLFGRIGVRVTPTHFAGRAAAMLDAGEITEPVGLAALPETPCEAAAVPAIRAEGRVMACCGDTMADPERWKALTLGHLATDGIDKLLDRSSRSVLVQALRMLGPRHLAAVAERDGALGRDMFDRRNICDVCRAVVTDETALTAVRRHLADPAVQADIAARRLVAHGEATSLDSAAIA
jgi:hypothetical protein